jgi:SagB-type dehydrogenase family enzyme
MRRKRSALLRLPAGDPDLVWELFHDNSKTSLWASPPTDEEVLTMMATMWESLPFEGYPVVELPVERTPLKLALDQAIMARHTARRMEAVPLGLRDVATILHYAYGVTRLNLGTAFPRPFRTVPSGGALYPLELFFHTTHVEGLAVGVYHYNAARNDLRLVREGDATELVADALVQREVGIQSSLMLFITAMFERTTFKYGDRGYRFTLLEAGHVAQNVNLVCHALGLGCVNLGGFFDRRIDDLLDLDGLTHSTIYMIAIGREVVAEHE